VIGFPGLKSRRRNTGNMPRASQANLTGFPGFSVTRVTVRGRLEVLFGALRDERGSANIS
jgi:hypothetical protein